MSTPTPAAPSASIAPTPGPWRKPYLDTLPNGLKAWRIDSAQATGVSVVALLPTGINDPEIEAIQLANAALIAAAPELRDALAALLERYDNRNRENGAYEVWEHR
jgi:hypothetical protein